MDILVYFQRYNDCLYYLTRAFNEYNKTSVLHLITDNPSAIEDKVKGVPNIEIVNVGGYNDTESKLLPLYKHQSCNPFWFEYPSLARWCVFSEYAEKNKLDKVFTTDWDVLYYRDIDELSQRYNVYDFTVTNRMCGGSSFWFDVSALKHLSDIIMDYYKDRDSDLRKQIGGNVCDMNFIELATYGKKVFDTKEIIDDECFDDNILNTFDWESEQPAGFQQGIKKINVIDGVPYCFNNKLGRNIRLNSTHFAGFTRAHIPSIMQKLEIV